MKGSSGMSSIRFWYWIFRELPVSLRGMTIEIYGGAALEAIRRASQVAAEVLSVVGRGLTSGVTTAEIDDWVRDETKLRGARPSQLGYHGFPASVCTSINDVVCHGIPKATDRLNLGDIINIDVTCELADYHGDTSRTFVIGEADSRAALVVDVARRCLDAGILAVCPDARLGDLGAEIEVVATSFGCSVVREYGGHGIGREMHQSPHIDHHGPAGRGQRLCEGMTFTLEPMILVGTPQIVRLADGWTVVTADGSPSAQFEHTLLVTSDGCEILTEFGSSVLASATRNIRD